MDVHASLLSWRINEQMADRLIAIRYNGLSLVSLKQNLVHIAKYTN
jgi:hypothetical protein